MIDNQGLINKINTDLRNAIYSQPQLIKVILDNIRPQLDEVLDPDTARRISKVYITGCGDSFFAGVAAELSFHQFGNVDVQPVEALNFSRYLSAYAPPNALLITISNSGKVSRTIEATQRASERIETLAITDAPESHLAKVAKRKLFPHIPPLASGGAGTRSYLASLLALFAIALHFGKARGSLTERQLAALWGQLEQTGPKIEKTLSLSQPVVDRYVNQSQAEKVFFVGGGPNYGTAMFGAAKLMEALSLEGVAVELEEWAHLQFHTTFEDTPYVLIAPPGNSYDRALEQAKGIQDSGGNLTAILDKNDQSLSAKAGVVFPVDSPETEAFTPLVYCIPTQLLAVQYAIHRNQSMKMRLDENRKQINFRQIFHSKIQP